MMPLQHPICLAYLERIDRKRGAEATRYNTQRHLSRFEIHCQLNGIDLAGSAWSSLRPTLPGCATNCA